jgi:hypothetical protein
MRPSSRTENEPQGTRGKSKQNEERRTENAERSMEPPFRILRSPFRISALPPCSLCSPWFILCPPPADETGFSGRTNKMCGQRAIWRDRGRVGGGGSRSPRPAGVQRAGPLPPWTTRLAIRSPEGFTAATSALSVPLSLIESRRDERLPTFLSGESARTRRTLPHRLFFLRIRGGFRRPRVTILVRGL